jgi:hypothetical protein
MGRPRKATGHALFELLANPERANQERVDRDPQTLRQPPTVLDLDAGFTPIVLAEEFPTSG